MEMFSASRVTERENCKRPLPEPEDVFTGVFPPPEDIIDDYQREKPLPFTWHGHQKGGKDSRDRTEWGYYREFAPPVLPAPAIFSSEIEEEIEQELVRQRPTTSTSSQTLQTTSRGQKNGESRARGMNEEAEQSGSHGPWLLRGLKNTRVNVSPLLKLRTLTRRHGSNTLSLVHQPPPTFGSNSKNYSRMAPKIHWWITAWFLLTTPVIIWDAAYCFFRCVDEC